MTPRPERHLAARPIPEPARRLVEGMRLELVPVASAGAAMAALPPGASTTVTCSVAKGLGATLDLAARLLDAGHDAVPHLAARTVEGPHHVAEIARWLDAHGVAEVFVVAGDAPHPAGPYPDGLALLRALLDRAPGITRVGVPAYPDGHPAIPAAALSDALRAKQGLLAAAGVAASATTQMCFDAGRVQRWLAAERAGGLELPIELGVPGAVDRARLVAMGVRLGVGASLRFLRAQRPVIGTLLGGGFDPTGLVVDVAAWAGELGVARLHAFTFNAVAETVAWQRRTVG